MENIEVDILLIEDNPNDAELTMRALRKNEISSKLHWIKDGEEALDYLFSKNKHSQLKNYPKFILLDLKLPKVSGIDVLKKIKQDPVLKTIPVAVLTSSNEERDRIECYNNYANSYVVKPVNFSEFIETVANIGLYWYKINQSLK